jgi:hypothetical protein
MRDNVFPPGLRGYVAAEQLGQNNRVQNLGMLAQLMQMQGQMQDRQLQQQMMPLKLQGMLAELEAQKEKAAQAQDKRAFFSPQNQQQYMEGGRPEFALPDDMQGPRQAAEPGQMNMGLFMRDAAARNFIPPETYYNHQQQNENRRLQMESNEQQKMFQLQQAQWQVEQRLQDKALDRQSREQLAQQSNQLRAEIAQMGIQGRQDAVRLAASLRQPPAAPPVTPVTIEDPNDPNKTLIVDGRTRQVIGAGPKATEAGKVAAGGVRLSPTAQKEVFEADDSVQAAQAAVQALTQAKGINDKAMGFLGAGTVAQVGTLLPENMRPAKVDATNELDNLVTNSALPQLRAIFAGNPTEGERKILLDIAGSSSASPSVRKGIFDRAIAAAERRGQFNAQKAQQLRGGTYFAPQGGGAPQAAPQAVPSAAPTVRKYNPATGKIE